MLSLGLLHYTRARSSPSNRPDTSTPGGSTARWDGHALMDKWPAKISENQQYHLGDNSITTKNRSIFSLSLPLYLRAGSQGGEKPARLSPLNSLYPRNTQRGGHSRERWKIFPSLPRHAPSSQMRFPLSVAYWRVSESLEPPLDVTPFLVRNGNHIKQNSLFCR